MMGIRNRWFYVVIGICFLSWAMPGIRPYWAITLFVAIGAGVWLLTRRSGGGVSGYLCDTCKYSYGDVCTRPEKPNATKCPDYKHT